MKRIAFPLLALLFVFFGATLAAQPVRAQKLTQRQLQKVLADSNSVNLLLDKILGDKTLRTQLLNKLAHASRQDPSLRKALQRTLSSAVPQNISQKASQQILVKFKPGVRVEQIRNMEREMGLQRVKEIKQLNIVVYRIPQNKSLKQVLQYCEQQPFVQYAEQDQTYRTLK
ncbi:MAG: hypothetical protein D6814_16980 [Calditrichaeota bacterium]|nr:MAG: hypothetical protein D6814_16980 [Calditrichota bacterium]